MISKKEKFQQFLNEYVHLSKKYITIEDLYKDSPTYDYFISGSDQIWNVRSCDFEDYFYLDFAENAKKISHNWKDNADELYGKIIELMTD